MKSSLLVLCTLLSGCTSLLSEQTATSQPASETVLITYHVTAGKEDALQETLKQAWDIYQNERLVYSYPHLIVKGTEANNKTRIVEVFTWVSHDAPDHAPDSVKKIWEKMSACCEPRDGHPPLEGGEMTLISPRGPS